MSTVKPVSSVEEYESHMSSLSPTTLSVVYFHAPWAAPCAQMSTILSTLASTYPASTPPTVSFLSIDAESLPDLSEMHDVTAVPFVALVKSGQTVQTVSGTDAATLRSAVEKHSSGTSTSKSQLPEKQSVTRPATQPEPVAAAATAPQTAAAKSSAASANGGVAKDLSSYSPSTSDPATAPEFSSESVAAASGSGGKEELNARLHDLTHAAPVMLFMKGTPSAPQCGFSRQLVSILRENSVRYGFFNILADDEVRQGLKEYSDWPTFPQLYLSGELVGGLDIVREEMGGNPGFFDEYRVSSGRNEGGGPAAPAAQAGSITA